MNEAVFGYAVVVRTAPIGGSTTAINSATGSVSEHSPGTGGVTATGRTEIGENGNGNTEQGVSIEVAAGIGIGIGLGVILLTGTMLYLVRLYRRRLRGSQLKDHYGIKQGPMPSSHSSQHLELPESQGKPQEMGTDREPGELSAEV
ncbi:hypothetical protein RRF57_013267 [Xylaria bambusicola]|uniref:Mid2 domain-containing protein n=1 Tax=Xylaria bambusicola TaxID=326684 RepID=A0AAN7ZBC3_9PEZI